MNLLLRRMFSRLYLIWFARSYSRVLKNLGSNSVLYLPFRIDGGQGISLGSRTVFQRGSWLYCCGIDKQPAALTVGTGCVFGYNNHITAVREVVIEDFVLTANNVYISDNLHRYEDTTRAIMDQPVRFKGAVVIGEGSWIGENACIIGAHVGRNCVIGANAVVTSDIPDYSVAVGVPAVVIKQYDQNLKSWVAVDTG
jgi:acetyltransferase-like isoleucine patch superfamily enzyme